MPKILADVLNQTDRIIEHFYEGIWHTQVLLACAFWFLMQKIGLFALNTLQIREYA